MKIKTMLSVAAVAVLIAGTANAEVDENLKHYKSVSGISGTVSSVGSDTLANLMTYWTEEFQRSYPNVTLQVQAAGSSTAPPALAEGTSNMAPMSRAMRPREIEAFENRNGYPPTQIRVAIDALAVFVHKDNPLEGLNIEQVDSIFSSTRRCGANADVTRWGDLGLTGNWVTRDIQLYGRNSVSGTYGYFKDTALCSGDFKNGVNEQPGSASVVQSISTSTNAIGYSGIGYLTSGVRALPLAWGNSTDYVEVNAETAGSGEYPLSRFLYVYVNKHPNRPLDPVTAEFVKLILSYEGQKIVNNDGYVPLPAAVAEEDLRALGLWEE
ncbi:phosphate binding protein [Idiomarina sp. A28L]|uniref:PstS family phosphate ABC transporter substrate-binding protein n=1 Tax=Idiomarina sp. A28L TaxID=1036674 RepID=UPI00021385B0|nr:phosphate ABC transporter substrate-binding protein PstS family protein [Idiomarina sp. A28L]EGN75196.1 phosphate binding protein [Idiomarina sp. A28L]